jgi:hypothetical protein
MQSEIEQRREVTHSAIRMARIWETGAGFPQLVEEGLDHCIDS